MILAKKFKIYRIDEKARQQLFELSDLSRQIYNEFLKRRIDSYETTKKTISYSQQASELTQLRNQSSCYRQLYSNSAQRVLRRLDENYRSFFGRLRKNRASIPRFHGKDYFFALEWIHAGYKIDDNRILTLSQGQGYKKIQIQLPKDYGFKVEFIRQIVIRYDQQHFWISIVGEVNVPEYQDNKKYIAIDAGVSNIATTLTSEGNESVVKNHDFLKIDKQADQLQSKLDKKYAKNAKKSKRYQRLQCKLRKRRRKAANCRRNFQHHVAKKIVKNRANTIFVEKLDTQKMAQASPYFHRLNRKTQNTGSMTLFLYLLAVKAMKNGKKVVAIDPRNTSKKCSLCGRLNSTTLWDRELHCKCGLRLDRDRNACINIMHRGFDALQLPESTRYRFTESIRHITSLAA